MESENFALMTEEFSNKVKAFRKDWFRIYDDISKTETPKVDGNGIKVVDRRPDGKDYITEGYMRSCLDKHFPGWSWERAGGLTFLGNEWVVADGELSIVDEHLLAFNINPPVRKFWGGDSVRIQFKSGQPHTPENIIDIGDNVQSAISGALKRCINRLTHIGDDIYGKRVEHEWAGSYETIFTTNPNVENFMRLANAIPPKIWSEKLEIIGVGSIGEITDFEAALEKLKAGKK